MATIYSPENMKIYLDKNYLHKTIEEMASELGCSKSTVCRWYTKLGFRGKEPGRKWDKPKEVAKIEPPIAEQKSLPPRRYQTVASRPYQHEPRPAHRSNFKHGNMKEYPIYRKLRNGKEYMKLNSSGSMIIVKYSPFRSSEYSFAIVHSDNPFMVKDFEGDEKATECGRDEWEKVYGQAQFHLSKSNCEQ